MSELKSRITLFIRNFAYPGQVTNWDLGLVRILFFSIVFWTTANSYIGEFSKIPATFHCPQTTTGAWAYIHLSAEAARGLMVLYNVVLLTALFGLFTRTSYWLCFFSSSLIYLNSLKYCYYDHRQLPLQLALVFFALLDKNSRFRLDHLIWSKSEKEEGDPAYLLQVLRIQFCLVFFAAGFSKLRYSGLDWITTETLRNFLILQNFFFEGTWEQKAFFFINDWVVRFPWLCQLLAFETIAIELMAPLALYRSRWSRSIVLNLFLMQIGIYFLMYFAFSPWFALYVFWIPDQGLKISKWLQIKSENLQRMIKR